MYRLLVGGGRLSRNVRLALPSEIKNGARHIGQFLFQRCKDDLVALSLVSTQGYPPSSNFVSIMAQRPEQSHLRPEGQYLLGQKDVAPGDKQKEIMIQHPYPERLFSFLGFVVLSHASIFVWLCQVLVYQ